MFLRKYPSHIFDIAVGESDEQKRFDHSQSSDKSVLPFFFTFFAGASILYLQQPQGSQRQLALEHIIGEQEQANIIVLIFPIYSTS